MAFTIIFFLSGCAGMGVRSTKDPFKKIEQARRLLQPPGRAAAAERLIWDAMTSFTESRNETGQAESFLAYAEFLNSPVVAAAEKQFRTNGFIDKSVTFDRRLEKSVDYFDMATPLFFKVKRYDALMTTSTGRGVALMNLGKRDDACASFDQGATFRDEQVRREPDAKPAAPVGYKSWNEYLSRLQKWAGCAS